MMSFFDLSITTVLIIPRMDCEYLQLALHVGANRRSDTSQQAECRVEPILHGRSANARPELQTTWKLPSSYRDLPQFA